MPLTKESPIAQWAEQNIAADDGYHVPSTKEAVPVLTTPIFAAFAAFGAVGAGVTAARVAGGLAANLAGYDAPEGAAPSSTLDTGRSVNYLLNHHPDAI